MPMSRRRFLAGAAAAVPLAGLDAGALLGASRPRVAVIGAGAFGGWTALQLRRAGAEVELIERRLPGPQRSSSGGNTRVIRAIYGPDRIYSEMVKRAFALWHELETSTGEPLYVETGALWMHRGDDAYVRAAAPILRDLGFAVDPMPVAEAAKRYPVIDFRGVTSVWLEQKAGALSARHACSVVRDQFQKEGGIYRTATVRPGAIRNGAMTALPVNADVYVFACGPWLGQLFPETIGDAVRPTRQEVYYFGTPHPERYASSRLPIWIDFGKRIIYGIPDPNGRSFKVADDTRGAPIEPTSDERHPSPEGIARARAFLAERFPELAKAPLLSEEVCQYENSPDGNLILDRHPEAKNVWLLGGGSGHGFKLSPVVGEMAAQAIVSGKPLPAQFALARLRDAKRKTQFDQ
jgi:glycine/D-amino acid oxidase-like deaminating enzyme